MPEYDPQEKELVRVLDIKLVPFLSAMMLALLLDRSSALHARITNYTTRAGLETDIGLDDYGFMWSIAAFAIATFAAVLPSTLLSRKIGPSTWFGACAIAWGVIAAATAATSNTAGYTASRFFLGAAQAGFLPCIVIYIVSFYTKEESATRFTYVIGLALVMQAFCGLFSHYVSRAEGYIGLAGWQLVYLLDGLFGISIGTLTLLYLPNYPETCHFLSPADRVLATSRGKDGLDDSGLVAGLRKVTKVPSYKFDYNQMLDAILDTRIWLIAIAYFCANSILDCLIILAPEVATTSFDINVSHRSLSNSTQEQLYQIIGDYQDSTLPIAILATLPYIFAFGFSLLLSQNFQERDKRTWPIMICMSVSSFGFLMLSIISPEIDGAGPARYFIGLLPAVIGVIASVPLIISLGMDLALDDTYRASVASIIIGPGQAFGLLIAGSPSLFSATNAPTFPLANGICTGLGLTASACIFAVGLLNQRESDGSGWGRAPGLRRLMNDQDEAKAWDLELKDVAFLKHNGMQKDDEEWN